MFFTIVDQAFVPENGLGLIPFQGRWRSSPSTPTRNPDSSEGRSGAEVAGHQAQPLLGPV